MKKSSLLIAGIIALLFASCHSASVHTNEIAAQIPDSTKTQSLLPSLEETDDYRILPNILYDSIKMDFSRKETPMTWQEKEIKLKSIVEAHAKFETSATPLSNRNNAQADWNDTDRMYYYEQFHFMDINQDGRLDVLFNGCNGMAHDWPGVYLASDSG